jgi:hypothetical protein
MLERAGMIGLCHNMKPLPEELIEQAKTLILKHQARGWSNIRIGEPDAASHPNRLVAHGTAPDGSRKYYSIDNNAAGFADLDRFLDSN